MLPMGGAVTLVDGVVTERNGAMESLPERIMGFVEATPIQAEDLLHLGGRAAVSRARSRLARSEQLMRIYRGVSCDPMSSRGILARSCCDEH